MDNFDPCEDCAMRLFNTKGYNLDGVGNPWSGRVIIVPNVDYKAYKEQNMIFSAQVEILCDIFSTGSLESIFILPLIRCNDTVSCKVNDKIIKNCNTYFRRDLCTYNFRDIMLLGSACKRILGVNIKDYTNSLIVSPDNRRYFVTYSPFTKYTNEYLYKRFVDDIQRWYFCSITNNFKGYDIIK